jgi:hypothetical protein
MLLIIFFIIASGWISTDWLYLSLIGVALFNLYLINGNLLKSLWLVFVPVYLFYRAIHSPDFSIFIQFSDLIMVLIVVNLYFFNKDLLSKELKKINSFNLFFSMALIVVLGLVSSYFSKYLNSSLFYLIQLIKFFLVFFISKVILADRQTRLSTILLIFVFILFISILIIFQKINGAPLGIPAESQNLFSRFGRYADESKSLYRPGGITTGPNEMATVLGMSIPLIFCAAMTKNNYNKLLVWSCLILSMIAVIFTAARAVWILIFILMPVVYYSLKQSGLIQIPAWFIRKPKLLIIGIIVFSAMVLPLVFNRISSLPLLFSRGGGAVYRLHHFEMGKKIAGIFPFGVGVNGFQYEIQSRFEPDYYFNFTSPAHNVFVEVMADFGVIGLPLFILLFYFLVKVHWPYNRQNISYLKIGIFWSVIGYILLLQVHPWLFERSASSLFWLLAGVNDDSD